MKKIVFTLLFLVSFSATAQVMGIRGGFNSSTVIEKDHHSSYKPGFYAGVLVQIEILDNLLYLQPEVNYSSQGAAFNERSFKGNLTLDYIIIPTLVKYRPLRFLNLYAGPQMSFMVNNPQLTSIDGSINLNKANFNSIDLSGVIGLAFETHSGFFIEGRYQLGFKNIIKDQTQLNLKNSVLSIGAGYNS